MDPNWHAGQDRAYSRFAAAIDFSARGITKRQQQGSIPSQLTTANLQRRLAGGRFKRQ
jgi:hypothetical protein